MRFPESFFSRNFPRIAFSILLLVGLSLTSLYSYLLFHTLAELFSIIIAGTIFILSWNFRRFFNDSFLLFIGAAALFYGGIDLLHTLAYKGMNVFVGYDANLPTQLWIAARALQAGSLLLAPFFIGRRLKLVWIHGGLTLVTGLLLLAIAARVFPVCYVEGVGLTPFKIASEYLIDLALAGAVVLLLRKRRALDPRFLALLIGSLVCTMLAELAFTFYINVYGISNLAGHLFKIAASYLVYKAIVETAAVTIYTDITQLRAAQAALSQSEATYRAIAQSIPGGGVYVFDRDLRYQVVEGTALDSIGLTKQYMEGRTVAEMIPEDMAAFQPVVEERCRRALAGETHSYETHYFRRVYWSQYAPLRNAAGVVIAGMMLTLDMTDQRKLEQELHDNASRIEVQRGLIEQREQDRLQIARDLHDGPVQTLTGAIFSLQALSLECQDAQALKSMEITRDLMKEALTELRGYAQELRPPVLFNFGLTRAFENHLEGLRQKYPALNVRLEIQHDPEPLPEAVRMTLFRIFQESLANILKHARASELSVALNQDDGHVSLEIADNGAGFEVPSDLLLLVRQGHLGLVGMRERAEAIGGHMEIIAAPGQGTRIRVRVPAPPAA